MTTRNWEYTYTFILILLFSIGSVGSTSLIATASVDAQSTSINLGSYTTHAGSNVTVPIKITNATDIAGGSAKILFNPSIVNVQAVTSGHFDMPTCNIDNANGSVHVAASKATAAGINEAVLANLVFKGMTEGSTALTIMNANFNYENGAAITPETSNGEINVLSSQTPFFTAFGTGEGTYPSIMGVHKGNFTPKCNITIHQMYTYTCPGTGGHSEHVIFFSGNGKEIANGNWNGYQTDYHNISFETPFTLYAGVVYNYEIRTGSYPLIIHNQSLTNEDGTITCTEFTDANGKIYNDWIPAIKLLGVLS